MGEIEGHALIYCDPPYINTTKYNHDIDHNKFHEWCRDRAREGHTIFVSEYTAPDDFKLVFEKEVLCELDKNSKSKRTERLYTID
jgi:DNA adenine methylase